MVHAPIASRSNGSTGTGRVFTRCAVACLFLGRAVAGCGSEEPAGTVDLIYPDTASMDVEPSPPSGCETAADCALPTDCCLAPVCEAGACRYTVVPGCCQGGGPCAVGAPHLDGVCETPCGAYGCASYLRLDDAPTCGEIIERFDFGELAEAGSLFTDVDWRGASAGPVFGVDLRVPASRRPTLALADARCEGLQPGPISGDCGPRLAPTEGWVASVRMPPLRLPPGRPLVVEGLLYDGRVGSAEAPPEIRVEALAGPSPTLLFTTLREPAPSAPAWRPFAADLGALGGQEVSLRLSVSATSGSIRSDRPIAFDALVVRVPCAREREAAGAAGRCGDADRVRVQGSDDALYRRVPGDVAAGCDACEAAPDCATLAPCERHRCQAGACLPDDAEGPCEAEGLPLSSWFSPESWSQEGDPWVIGSEDDTLRFPLATFEGSPSGLLTTPPFFVPRSGAALSLDLRLETEWDDAPPGTPQRPVDHLRIELEPAPLPGGAPAPIPAVELWESGRVGGTTRGLFVPLSLPISAAPGARVRLRFVFEAGDDAFNDYGGVWIRRPRLTARTDAPDDDGTPAASNTSPR